MSDTRVLRATFYRARGLCFGWEVRLEVVVGETSRATDRVEAKNAVWDTALEVEILGEEHEEALLKVYTQEAPGLSSSFSSSFSGTPKREKFLGLLKVPLLDIPTANSQPYQVPIPAWMSFYSTALGNSGYCFCEVLMSLELLGPARSSPVPRPMKIKLQYQKRDQHLQVSLIGLRDLIPLPKKFDTSGIPNLGPIEVETQLGPWMQRVPAVNNTDPFNPNCQVLLSIPLKLTVDATFWPCIIFRVIEYVSGDDFEGKPKKGEILGELQLDLPSIFNMTLPPPPCDMESPSAQSALAGALNTSQMLTGFNETMEIGIAGPHTSMALDGMALDQDSPTQMHNSRANVYAYDLPPSDVNESFEMGMETYADIPMQESPQFAASSLQNLEPTDTFFHPPTTPLAGSRPISSVDPYQSQYSRPAPAPLMMGQASDESSFRLLIQGQLPPEPESTDPQSSVPLGAPHKPSHRYPEELEHCNMSPYMTFPLIRAAAPIGSSIRDLPTWLMPPQDIVQVGNVKCRFTLKDGPCPDSPPTPLEQSTTEKWVCRVYICSAQGLVPPRDPSTRGVTSIYATVDLKLGDDIVESYPKTGDGIGHIKSTCDPVFGHMFKEFQVTTPGSPKVTLSVCDGDGDLLIGSTTIDLDDRRFIRTQPTSYADIYTAPTELRSLWTPISTEPQGKLEVLVQLLTPEQAAAYLPLDMKANIPMDFEVQTTIHEARNFEDKKDGSSGKGVWGRNGRSILKVCQKSNWLQSTAGGLAQRATMSAQSSSLRFGGPVPEGALPQNEVPDGARAMTSSATRSASPFSFETATPMIDSPASSAYFPCYEQFTSFPSVMHSGLLFNSSFVTPLQYLQGYPYEVELRLHQCPGKGDGKVLDTGTLDLQPYCQWGYRNPGQSRAILDKNWVTLCSSSGQESTELLVSMTLVSKLPKPAPPVSPIGHTNQEYDATVVRMGAQDHPPALCPCCTPAGAAGPDSTRACCIAVCVCFFGIAGLLLAVSLL